MDGVLFNKAQTHLIVCPSGYTRTSFDIPNGVTSIAEMAFSNYKKLERATIPDSVTSIGSGAFRKCISLESINIPSGVTSIADSTFSGCEKLKNITIPAGVTTIGDTVFWGCKSLKSVIIPNKVTAIQDRTFIFCDNIETIFLPDTVLSIGIGAIPEEASQIRYSLNGTTGEVTITSATLGDGRTTIEIPSEISGYQVSTINASAFAGCTNLETIFLPDNGLSIGDSAIPGKTAKVKYSLDETKGEVTITGYSGNGTAVEIPAYIGGKPVTAIGDNAFFFSQYLESVTMPDTVTSIGENAFAYGRRLKSIAIPSNVKSIGKNAFDHCNFLTSITIPAKVESIGENAFGYCLALESITVDKDNDYYSSSKDGVLFNKNQKELIAYPSGNTSTSYTIPTGVKSIGKNGLAYGLNLTSITIPDSVTSIGENAFADCYNLTSITIPAKVESIGDNAFANCEKLTSITVAEGNPNYASESGVLFNKDKTKLIKYPFDNTVTPYVISSKVTSIARDAFIDCYNLTSITVEDGNPNYSSVDGVLFDKDKTRLIVCPGGYTGTSFDIPNSVTSIAEKAFSYCEKLERVTIPDSVTLIGNEAFGSCTSLESINIPSGVTSIGNSTFSGCESLESIMIPVGVTSIGDAAFWACDSLEIIFLPDTVQSIGIGAISAAVSKVKYSLDGATGEVTITSATLGSGRTTIEIPLAFADYTSLETIFLPEDVSDIDTSAIPAAVSKVKYSLNETKGEVTITAINLGEDKASAAIPATIGGHPVVAVAASEQSKVGTHTHRGGTATYTSRAVCDLCGKEYGDLLYYAPDKSDTVAPDKDGNVVVTIDKSNVTTDGKTEVTVSESVADTILEQVASSESKKVIIDATTAKNAASEPVAVEPGHSTEVSLPEETVKKLAEMEDIEITIATDNGKVVLDQESVAAVAAKAGDDGQVTLVIETVEQNKNVLKIELKLQTSNGIVTDFNQGNVAVTVAVPKDMAVKKVVCVFIDENGKMSKVKGQKNADGTFTFITGHFSTYAIMAEEEADTAIAAQKEETLAALAGQQLTARSKLVTMKNGKKAVKITWYNENGKMMDFDGVEIYRSAKRNSGYGKKPIFTTEKNAYYNTAIQKGTKYYYKVRGYVVIDGQKYYTDYSLKAIRTVK